MITIRTIKPKKTIRFRSLAIIIGMLFCWIVPFSSFAYDVIVDGIYYVLDIYTYTATVVPTSSDEDVNGNGYSGHIRIPSNFDYDYNTYSVTSIGYYAFNGCEGLISIEIPSSVTSIGESAFSGCTGLTSVEIPNSVTEIGYEAFHGCTGLSSLDIANGVTSIGSSAFSGCTGLTSITVDTANSTYDSRDYCNAIIETTTNTLIAGCKNTIIPNSVTSICDCAFSGCTDLTSIEIPSSVTVIGDYAFDGTAWYSNQPEGLIYIGNVAYKYKISIGDVSLVKLDIILRNGTVSISGGAFSDCYSGLKSIYIPNSVTSIGNSAFYGCTGLTSIVIPNSVTSIGGSAFSYCSGLTSVFIPNSVTSIGESAFSACTGLNSITVCWETPIYIDYDIWWGVDKTTCILYVPYGSKSDYEEWYFTNIVERAPVRATGSCGDNLTYTIFPDMTMVISGSGAMKDYLLATHINGEYYQSIQKVVIETGVTSIGSNAFDCCTVLSSVTIPNSVTSIGESAFFGCEGLTSLEIPNSVTSIGRSAFYDCTSLTSITIERGTPSSVGSNAFYNVNKSSCTLYVPAGSKSAYESASGWSEFQNIVEYTPVLDVLATGSCGDNVTYTIYSDKSMVLSGTGAMWPYSSQYYFNDDIQHVIIEDGVTSIGNEAFKGCKGLTSVEIPNSVTSIGSSAFESCTGLTSVGIPNRLTTVGSLAFYGCTGLTSVTIPNSVTSIDFGAFGGCSGMTSLTVEWITPFAINDYTFAGVNTTSCTLYVPYGSKTSYENHEFWSEFQNIVENTPAPEVLATGQCGDNVSFTLYSDMTLVISGTGSMDNYPELDTEYYQTIENVIIEEGVTSICDQACYKYKSLVSVTIPNSVTSIGNNAFNQCYSLTSVTIPNNVTSIGSNSFTECISLTSVDIPNSVTSIGNSAFERCGKLHSVTIPNSVRTIGNSAFQGCTGLTSVDIPNSVTTIGSSAFKDCTGLTSVDIPNSVTTIGSSAFEGCTGLTSVAIPNSVTSIGLSAFAYCSDLTSVTVEWMTPLAVDEFTFGGVAISSCTLYVPYGSKTSYENDEYWSGFQDIVEYTPVPDVLATGSCGDNVTYILYDDMTMVISGTGEMWDYSYDTHINDDYYQSIKSVIIEEGVTSIGDNGFQCWTGLTSVTIPNSVTSIGYNPFHRCTNLTSIIVDSGNTIYDSRNDCNAIIETATNTLIKGCNNTVIPNNVTGIFDWAFYLCDGLTSLTIPNGVTFIGRSAFSECTGLTSVEISNSVDYIGDYAFYDSPGLTSVTIPNSVCEIGYRAFSGTGLVSVIVESETPPDVYDNSFDKTNCTLYVPAGSKSAYENASGWNEFEHIVEFGEEPDTDISTLDNAIYVEQTEGRIGGTKDISVKMKNDFDVRGFQFTMELPEGTTINGWTLNQGRMPAGTTMNKVFSTEGIDENKINVVCALNDGEKTFTGNDGLIATVNVSFAEDMEEGTYPIYLTNNSISDATAEYQLELSDVKSTLVLEDYVVGDTNGDGKVLVGDVIAILNYIVGSPSNNFNAKAADVNGDGKILVGDVIAVLNIIVNQ